MERIWRPIYTCHVTYYSVDMTTTRQRVTLGDNVSVTGHTREVGEAPHLVIYLIYSECTVTLRKTVKLFLITNVPHVRGA